LFSVFVFGLSLGVYKYPPFQQISNVKNWITSSKVNDNRDLLKFSSCNIPKSSEVMKGSHAFIGHAYGSPSKAKAHSYLASNAQNFISTNSSKLKTLIFTGDVFSVPSLDKWKRLSFEANDGLEIFVAPGNHDVSRSDSRDIFLMSQFGQSNYPFIKYLDNSFLILEDSVKTNWKVSNKTIELANNANAQQVIIGRHNLPTDELSRFANSQQEKSKLGSIEELVQKFDNNILFYWIIGDSGAFPNLPRLTCLTFRNHTFIINGLGEISGDSVVLYHKGAFSEYELSSMQ
jgi:hypothetical protein